MPTDTPSFPSTTGPAMLPRISRDEKFANGTDRLPLHPDSDGLALVTLINPPTALRPNSALWGPRTNSTWPTSIRSMFDELVLSWGTPSKYVATAAFAGLAPMPRNRGLLNLRAVNSVKYTFGANRSLTILASELRKLCSVKVVRLIGRS